MTERFANIVQIIKISCSQTVFNSFIELLNRSKDDTSGSRNVGIMKFLSEMEILLKDKPDIYEEVRQIMLPALREEEEKSQ
jgi:hypothetical protein